MGRKGQRSVEAKDEKVGEAAVILRWQDLPEDDPDRGMIIVSREDRMGMGSPPGKGKGKENEKPKGKGKWKKEAGPPLANYIRSYEFNHPCKMCPNPDWHRTFRCPNLTPGLKERLKEARLRCGTDGAFLPEDRCCHICLSKDHWSSSCDYSIEYPRGADIGPHAELVCMCCGEVSPHEGEPGFDWKARAVLKPSCFLADGTVRQEIV
ncbi:hypothetical protein OROHE_014380 [Orobanche hederae]